MQQNSNSRVSFFNTDEIQNKSFHMEVLCLLAVWGLITLGIYNHRMVAMQCTKLPELAAEDNDQQKSGQCMSTAGMETMLIEAALLFGYAVIWKICRSSRCNKSLTEPDDSMIVSEETAPLLQ